MTSLAPGLTVIHVSANSLDNHVMKTESLTPEFKFDADYTLEGQLLLLPIRGTGTCTITLGESVNCFPGILHGESDKNPLSHLTTRWIFLNATG